MEEMTLSEIASLVQGCPESDLNLTMDVSLCEVIGQGKFGIVRKATWSPTAGKITKKRKTMPVAVKILAGEVVKETQWSNETVWKLTCCEFDAWFRITPHDNVLPVIGMYYGPKSPGLVAPYISQTQFKYWLASICRKGLGGKRRCQLVIDIAEGLAHLHSKDINLVHGDLHIGNIFLHQDRAIIADFGLSKLANTTTISPLRELRSKFAIYNSVPELDGNIHAHRTKQSDIFMFGIIARQIFAEGFTDEAKKQDLFGKELRYLATHCCASNAVVRPSAQEIVKEFQTFKTRHLDDALNDADGKTEYPELENPYARS